NEFMCDKHHWAATSTDVMALPKPDGAVWNAHGKPVIHAQIPHEVGHALGLYHIGYTLCMKAGGERQNCFTTVSDPYQAGTDSGANVMGAGTLVEPVNAAPWQEHIVLHFPDDPSNPEDWKAFGTPKYPRLLTTG